LGVRKAKQNSSVGANVTDRVARHGAISWDRRSSPAAISFMVVVDMVDWSGVCSWSMNESMKGERGFLTPLEDRKKARKQKAHNTASYYL